MSEQRDFIVSPWEAESEVENGITIRDASGDGVCEIQTPDDLAPNEQDWARARLITAAPRMGALLLSMYQHVSHGGPTRGEVESVLRDAGLIS